MALTKRRRVRVHDRHLSIQAQQAIGGDIVRALVELITNSDDSYRRLEDAGVRRPGPTYGRIEVEMDRRRDGTTLRVRDYAEGMALQHMRHGVGTYAGETSGIREGGTVRGMWGHGLKDAILGLGHGRVMSIRDRVFCECALSSGPNGAPVYEYGDESSISMLPPGVTGRKMPSESATIASAASSPHPTFAHPTTSTSNRTTRLTRAPSPPRNAVTITDAL
jgi:hypothetical protein